MIHHRGKHLHAKLGNVATTREANSWQQPCTGDPRSAWVSTSSLRLRGRKKDEWRKMRKTSVSAAYSGPVNHLPCKNDNSRMTIPRFSYYRSWQPVQFRYRTYEHGSATDLCEKVKVTVYIMAFQNPPILTCDDFTYTSTTSDPLPRQRSQHWQRTAKSFILAFSRAVWWDISA